MRYREFLNWCNDRASDGCWGNKEAITCIQVIKVINTFPFFIRDKVWKTYHMDYMEQNIINPTNKKIQEVCGK